MPLNVLLVSIAFPPKRDPESLQVAKYCNFLKADKRVNLSVITSANPTLFMEADASLAHYGEGITVAKSLRIVENRYTNYLIRRVAPSMLQRPDSKASFWRQSGRVLEAIPQKPDVLYSRSYPVSSTLLALQLKKRWPDVPWVLHLSDPWAQSSQTHRSPGTTFAPRAHAWNCAKEKEAFGLADRISLTSRKTIELYAAAYPQWAHKFVYFPNVFDDNLVVENPYTPGPVLNIVYNGGFGEARTPLHFLEAIHCLWKSSAGEIGGALRFAFTGEMTRENRDIFNRYNHIPWIQHLGMIPYEDVVTLQRSADVLVNIDSDIPDARHAVFFPSKLLDYMVAQRRILAITNPHSTTHEVVQGTLGECFDFGETERLCAHLLDVYRRFKGGDTAYFYKSALATEFSARHNAGRLAELFSQVAPRPAAATAG